MRTAPRIRRSLPPARGTIEVHTAKTHSYRSRPASSSFRRAYPYLCHQRQGITRPIEGQQINQSAATGRTDKNDADHVSLQNPVSHPEQSGIGGQEEPTESQDNMKHDPEKPDSQKRKETLEYGQNKPLDAADK
jgi:hypothetical protein